MDSDKEYNVCGCSQSVGCNPTNVPLWENPIQALYHVGIYGFFHSQESQG